MGLLDTIADTTRNNTRSLGGLLGLGDSGNGLLSDLDLAKRNALSRLRYNVGKNFQSTADYLSGDPNHWMRQPATPEGNAEMDQALMDFGSGLMPGAIAGTFIGRKGAANLGKEHLFDEAEAMEKAGVPAWKIWQEHMIGRSPVDRQMKMELDDSGSKSFVDRDKANKLQGLEDVGLTDAANQQRYLTQMKDVFSHPELEKAYNLGEYAPSSISPMKVVVTPDMQHFGEYRGYGSDAELPWVKLNSSVKDDQSDWGARSTLLHELQHHIQGQEGFASGGSAEFAKNNLKHFENRDLRQNIDDKLKFDAIRSSSIPASMARLVQEADAMTRRSNLRPRSITGIQDWYELSHKFRGDFGPMPKKPGLDRDNWIRAAFEMVRDNRLQKAQNEFGQDTMSYWLSKSPDELKRIGRQYERQTSPLIPNVMQYDRDKAKYNRLKNMSPFDLYERLGGEAEARLVQDRRDMTLDERKNSFPFALGDWGGVPVRDLVGHDLSAPGPYYPLSYQRSNSLLED